MRLAAVTRIAVQLKAVGAISRSDRHLAGLRHKVARRAAAVTTGVDKKTQRNIARFWFAKSKISAPENNRPLLQVGPCLRRRAKPSARHNARPTTRTAKLGNMRMADKWCRAAGRRRPETISPAAVDAPALGVRP